jgi:hypothetical protein
VAYNVSMVSSPKPVSALSAASVHPHLMRVLRPLVRLLIHAGVTFPAFADLVRKVYVSIAVEEFSIGEKQQTDSRVTLLTGVHRKEVRRLRSGGEPDLTIPADLSLTSQVLARWLGSPDFTDEDGQPLPLARIGTEVSFETLVASVTKDMRSRAVLDDWLERGLVMIDDRDRVRLLAAALIPRAGDDHQLYYFGRNLHDHLAAAAANVMGHAPPFLERAVHYDGLRQQDALHLQGLSQKLAMTALKSANREAQKAIASGDKGNWRWNFGLYVYVEPGGEAEADQTDR